MLRQGGATFDDVGGGTGDAAAHFASSSNQEESYDDVYANDYNNRVVEFRLDERIPNTNQWRQYAKTVYTLKRSFASDFDF